MSNRISHTTRYFIYTATTFCRYNIKPVLVSSSVPGKKVESDLNYKLENWTFYRHKTNTKSVNSIYAINPNKAGI